MDAKARVISRSYHRNGVGGMGFDVFILKGEKKEGEGNRMLVIRFPKACDNMAGGILCAAFDLDMLANGDIQFGSNSWRGDVMAETVDQLPTDAEVWR